MPRCADFTCGRWRPERLAPEVGGRAPLQRTLVLLARVRRARGARRPRHAGGAGGVGGSAAAAEARRAAAPSRRDHRERARKRARVAARLRAAGSARSCSTWASWTPDVILKALAAQGGVSYLPSFDVDRVMSGPAWLPAETVRALGLVPFEADEAQKRLRVVCARAGAARGDARAAQADRLDRRAVSGRRRGAGRTRSACTARRRRRRASAAR